MWNIVLVFMCGISTPVADSLELKWAESKPVEKVTDATGVDLSCTEKKAYLHRKPVLTRQDMVSARVIQGGGTQYLVEITLTPEAARKMSEVSMEHQDKPLVALINNKVHGAIVVKTQLKGKIPFAGFTTRAAAEKLADAIEEKR